MPFHLYKVRKANDTAKWLGMRIEYDEDRWVATCQEVDATGEPTLGGAAVAPKFYGITAEQAHRRMLEVLQSTFDEVTAAAEGLAT